MVHKDRKVRCFLKVPQGRGPGPAGPSQQPRQQRGPGEPGHVVSKHQPGDQYSDTHRSVSLRGGGGSGGGGAAEWEVGAGHWVNTGRELGEGGHTGEDQEA